jgi:hypothetical protein
MSHDIHDRRFLWELVPLRLECLWSIANRWFRKYARYNRDRGQDTDRQERPSCPFALISGEPIRKQQTKASAKRNTCASDQHDLRDCKTSRGKSHIALDSHERRGISHLRLNFIKPLVRLFKFCFENRVRRCEAIHHLFPPLEILFLAFVVPIGWWAGEDRAKI